jgi:hypothetical protein
MNGFGVWVVDSDLNPRWYQSVNVIVKGNVEDERGHSMRMQGHCKYITCGELASVLNYNLNTVPVA